MMLEVASSYYVCMITKSNWDYYFYTVLDGCFNYFITLKTIITGMVKNYFYINSFYIYLFSNTILENKFDNYS
jgi:hypothetical protein